MEREFKVGDKVKIRQWDDMAKEFGVSQSGDIQSKPHFVCDSDMEELCGETALLTGIEDDGTVKLAFDNESELTDTGWFFSTDMIEIAEEE